MKNQFRHFAEDQRNESLKFQRFEELFNGTLGTWKTYPVDFKLKQDKNLVCSRPYTVPKVYKETFEGVKNLVLLGVLERSN